MEKIKIKLGEALQLENEINGFVMPETNNVIFTGFINQNLPIILKYELKELSEFLKKERKKVESLRDELIKKYGDDDGNGGYLVKMFDETKDEEGNVIAKMINEKYLKFDEEYSTLLNQEIEVNYPEIGKEDLKEAGKTKDNYTILFKLIKKEEVI